MVADAEQLLRGLAASDEKMVRSVLTAAPARARPTRSPSVGTLPASTVTLIRLAALLATGASTTSLRWAVELALRAGAREHEIVEVLASVAMTVGSARVVAVAPRLALAIGYDIEIEDSDGY
jgi:4-carboxymuconolactone decarboxylase